MSDSKEIWCNVVLIMPNHSITGELSLGDSRLSDMLNDPRKSYLELHNAAFSRLSEPGKVIERSSRTIIPKDKLVIAFELGRDRIANDRRFFSYRKKSKYSVFLATADIEVRGFLHATTAVGLEELEGTQGVRFVPVTDAVVTFSNIKSYGIRQDFIVVNLHAIQYFSLGEAVEPETEPRRESRRSL